jgi:hypothetical protein
MPFWTLWGNETYGLAVGIRLEVWASVASVNFDGEWPDDGKLFPRFALRSGCRGGS